MASPVAAARSFLFVPATRPDRFAKALASGAGCLILDLEDAVAPEQKAAAREQLDASLREFSPGELARTLVRINPVGTPWHALDVEVLATWVSRGLAGAVVPKAEAAPALRAVADALGTGAQLVPLVESLDGLDELDLLARCPQVERLAFGHLDFQLDLGIRCGADERELDAVRFSIVAASRRAHLPPPIDGVTTDTSDDGRLQADTARGRAFGFTAKLCIHPAQVQAVNACFTPSEAELAWAKRVMEGAGLHQGQAFSLDGRMVDLPVIRLAEKMLLQAAA